MQVRSSGESAAVVLLPFEVGSAVGKEHATGLDTFYMLKWSHGCRFAYWHTEVIVASFALFARTQGRLNSSPGMDSVHEEKGTMVMKT